MAKRTDILPDKVAQALQERITSNHYPPGTVLPAERILQEEHGVSRTVVREALKTLAARGLITVSFGKGAVVETDLTGAATEALLLAFQRAKVFPEDLLVARSLLEPQVAELAALNATTVQVRDLKELVLRLEELDFDGDALSRAKSQEHWSELDAQFHVLLAEASQNPVLAILIKVIVGIMWREEQGTKVELTVESLKKAMEQHKSVATAIEERDGAKARSIMSGHLELTRQDLANANTSPKRPLRL